MTTPQPGILSKLAELEPNSPPETFARTLLSDEQLRSLESAYTDLQHEKHSGTMTPNEVRGLSLMLVGTAAACAGVSIAAILFSGTGMISLAKNPSPGSVAGQQALARKKSIAKSEIEKMTKTAQNNLSKILDGNPAITARTVIQLLNDTPAQVSEREQSLYTLYALQAVAKTAKEQGVNLDQLQRDVQDGATQLEAYITTHNFSDETATSKLQALEASHPELAEVAKTLVMHQQELAQKEADAKALQTRLDISQTSFQMVGQLGALTGCEPLSRIGVIGDHATRATGHFLKIADVATPDKWLNSLKGAQAILDLVLALSGQTPIETLILQQVQQLPEVIRQTEQRLSTQIQESAKEMRQHIDDVKKDLAQQISHAQHRVLTAQTRQHLHVLWQVTKNHTLLSRIEDLLVAQQHQPKEALSITIHDIERNAGNPKHFKEMSREQVDAKYNTLHHGMTWASTVGKNPVGNDLEACFKTVLDHYAANDAERTAAEQSVSPRLWLLLSECILQLLSQAPSYGNKIAYEHESIITPATQYIGTVRSLRDRMGEVIATEKAAHDTTWSAITRLSKSAVQQVAQANIVLNLQKLAEEIQQKASTQFRPETVWQSIKDTIPQDQAWAPGTQEAIWKAHGNVLYESGPFSVVTGWLTLPFFLIASVASLPFSASGEHAPPKPRHDLNPRSAMQPLSFEQAITAACTLPAAENLAAQINYSNLLAAITSDEPNLVSDAFNADFLNAFPPLKIMFLKGTDFSYPVLIPEQVRTAIVEELTTQACLLPTLLLPTLMGFGTMQVVCRLDADSREPNWDPSDTHFVPKEESTYHLTLEATCEGSEEKMGMPLRSFTTKYDYRIKLFKDLPPTKGHSMAALLIQLYRTWEPTAESKTACDSHNLSQFAEPDTAGRISSIEGTTESLRRSIITRAREQLMAYQRTAIGSLQGDSNVEYTVGSRDNGENASTLRTQKEALSNATQRLKHLSTLTGVGLNEGAWKTGADIDALLERHKTQLLPFHVDTLEIPSPTEGHSAHDMGEEPPILAHMEEKVTALNALYERLMQPVPSIGSNVASLHALPGRQGSPEDELTTGYNPDDTQTVTHQ